MYIKFWLYIVDCQHLAQQHHNISLMIFRNCEKPMRKEKFQKACEPRLRLHTISLSKLVIVTLFVQTFQCMLIRVLKPLRTYTYFEKYTLAWDTAVLMLVSWLDLNNINILYLPTLSINLTNILAHSLACLFTCSVNAWKYRLDINKFVCMSKIWNSLWKDKTRVC